MLALTARMNITACARVCTFSRSTRTQTRAYISSNIFPSLTSSLSIQQATRSFATSQTTTTTLLPHVVDKFNGVTIDISKLSHACTAQEFDTLLAKSLSDWKANARRGIWFKVPKEKSELIPIAIKHGFEFHHAQSQYVMMTQWIAEDKNMLPAYASNYLGVGAFVINAKGQCLTIAEKFGHGGNFWKLPGGACDVGEHIPTAVVREVKEETGIDAKYECLIAVRFMTNFRFGMSDLYFINILKAKDDNQPLQPQAEEIASVKWINVEDFLNLPHQQFLFSHTRASVLHEVKRILHPELNLPCKGMRTVPVARLYGEGYNMLWTPMENEWYDDHHGVIKIPAPKLDKNLNLITEPAAQK